MRILAPLLALLALPAAPQTPPPSTQDLEEAVRRFVAVLATAMDNAAERPDLDAAIYRGAIPAMLRPLDPHSVFFDREQFEQLREMERSVTKGFGTIVSILPGRVIILQTMPGSPSQKAGLAPGDEILAINNIPLAFLDLDQLIQLLSYSRQREAQLLVRRQGEARPVQLTLSPAELDSPSVDRSFLLEPDIGYIRISSFDAKTAGALRETVQKLGGERLRGLVLDLRDNQGGVVQSAVAAAALFLEPGSVLFSARGRNTPVEEVKVPEGFTPYRFKLAVLVNGRTASAAELFTGAIQDNDRGAVLGEPTFGKALVQSIYRISMGAGLALTTGRYYTPSGRLIQRPWDPSFDEYLTYTLRLDPTSARARSEADLRYTDAGRKVYGGGGIEPDHIVPGPVEGFNPTRFGRELYARQVFDNYAQKFSAEGDTRIVGQAKDRRYVRRGFEVDDAMIADFRRFLEREQRIRIDEQAFAKDLEFIRTMIKYRIDFALFGIEEARRTLIVAR